MTNWNSTQAETCLRALLNVAMETVRADHCLPPHLPDFPRDGRCIVIGAGKAAAAMAQACEHHWKQDPHFDASRLSGLVIVPYGHGLACQHLRVCEAAHPIPDAAGYQAASELLDSVQNLQTEDTVICLLSGGGSALMSLPAPGISLDDKRAINHALLRSGARIHEINCVRKHLSAIKGGRLALACAPARLFTFIISDVAGDDANIIASGPTLPDQSSCADALEILHRYAIPIPDHVLSHLRSDAAETPKPDQLPAAHSQIIACANDALQAASAWASGQGIDVTVLSDRLEGEASELGRAHASLAKNIAASDANKPHLLLSGGETTVTLTGKGKGGRNTEYLLSLCLALEGHPSIYGLAADTDGRDGSEHNAGAIFTPDSLQRATRISLSALDCLQRHDAYTFFEALQDLVITGPSLTNVNDFRAILIC